MYLRVCIIIFITKDSVKTVKRDVTEKPFQKAHQN